MSDDQNKLSLIPSDPAHDVVAKCKNGKLHRPVDDVYVIIRIDLEASEPDADAIAYSYDTVFGSQFVEQIACRELYGRFWNHEKDGSPCFDPFEDGGGQRPMPHGRLMMWDAVDDTGNDENGLPKPIVPCLTIYGEGPEHKPMKRYKVAKVQLTIHDLMSIETEGDKMFL